MSKKFICKRVSNGMAHRCPCEEATERLEGGWEIEIEDLWTLLRFIEKYGSVIIQEDGRGDMELIIYDDYYE